MVDNGSTSLNALDQDTYSFQLLLQAFFLDALRNKKELYPHFHPEGYYHPFGCQSNDVSSTSLLPYFQPMGCAPVLHGNLHAHLLDALQRRQPSYAFLSDFRSRVVGAQLYQHLYLPLGISSDLLFLSLRFLYRKLDCIWVCTGRFYTRCYRSLTYVVGYGPVITFREVKRPCTTCCRTIAKYRFETITSFRYI